MFTNIRQFGVLPFSKTTARSRQHLSRRSTGPLSSDRQTNLNVCTQLIDLVKRHRGCVDPRCTLAFTLLALAHASENRSVSESETFRHRQSCSYRCLAPACNNRLAIGVDRCRWCGQRDDSYLLTQRQRSGQLRKESCHSIPVISRITSRKGKGFSRAYLNHGHVVIEGILIVPFVGDDRGDSRDQDASLVLIIAGDADLEERRFPAETHQRQTVSVT